MKNLSCWVVSEGIAGTENQCIAVAEALGVAFEIKRMKLRQPWRALSPYLGLEQDWSFIPALSGPWPDLVIASGRKSIAASRYIKRMSGGKAFTVQIQDPRIDPAQFDLVVVPAHDPTRGGNVIVTTAAPNRVTTERLAAARKEFPDFESIKSPRVAVLIGGSSKAYQMTSDTVRTLATQLNALDAGLMITTSRRTGVENEGILRNILSPPPLAPPQAGGKKPAQRAEGGDAFIWDGAGENPYSAMLAWADYILVTADSASMLSDACSTGKPSYMIPLKGGHPRIDKLHQNLQNHGALRVFDGALEHWEYAPLNDAQMIADEIRKRL